MKATPSQLQRIIQEVIKEEIENLAEEYSPDERAEKKRYKDYQDWYRKCRGRGNPTEEIQDTLDHIQSLRDDEANQWTAGHIDTAIQNLEFKVRDWKRNCQNEDNPMNPTIKKAAEMFSAWKAEKGAGQERRKELEDWESTGGAKFNESIKPTKEQLRKIIQEETQALLKERTPGRVGGDER